jgi:hypothetical protein
VAVCGATEVSTAMPLVETVVEDKVIVLDPMEVVVAIDVGWLVPPVVLVMTCTLQRSWRP